uniref:PCRF domain-containing protein n=1 Tax=Steinernema glaseri TaxID=37863 RepID=A0A1I7YXF6_9BILA
MFLILQSGQEQEKSKAKATLATFKDAITDEDIPWFLNFIRQLEKSTDDLITDEKELKTLKNDKTTLVETIQNYEKLEKELKDLKSAEPETTNNTD